MTKNISIPYDKHSIEISLRERNIAYLSDRFNPSSQRNVSWKPDTKLRILAERKNILILLADSTRDIPFHLILDHFFSSLSSAPKSVRLCLATGTHDGDNEENQAILRYSHTSAKHNNTPLTGCYIHNCYTSTVFYAGTTSRGNDIYVNQIINDCDLILIHADMKNHYFAGYSNPIKYIIPGICAFKTIEYNHSLALDGHSTFGHHPLHPDKNRRKNPVAEDMWEGFQIITKNIPAYVLLTLSMNQNIVWKRQGLLADVLPEGIQKVDEKMGLMLKPSKRLIVSCGGYPNDESLYIAQRALELTKNALVDGGEILFIAGCRNGIGPVKSLDNFYYPLKGHVPELIKRYAKNYKMYTHKVYKFAQLINRTNRIYLYSLLSDQQISEIHLIPVNNVQILVNNWIEEDTTCKINIFLDGNKTAVYPY